MPSVNFIAAYSMAELFQARIFLADVDSRTGQMTPRTLLSCIKENKTHTVNRYRVYLLTLILTTTCLAAFLCCIVEGSVAQQVLLVNDLVHLASQPAV